MYPLFESSITQLLKVRETYTRSHFNRQSKYSKCVLALPSDLQELRGRIIQSATVLKNNPEMIKNVIQSMKKRSSYFEDI